MWVYATQGTVSFRIDHLCATRSTGVVTLPVTWRTRLGVRRCDNWRVTHRWWRTVYLPWRATLTNVDYDAWVDSSVEPPASLLELRTRRRIG